MDAIPSQAASNSAPTHTAIAEIMALLPQVSEQFEPQQTRRWMLQHCSNPAIIDILLDSTLLTLQVVDAIGELEPVNGITISKQFGIPKGSISKIARRLLAKQLIQQESLPNNRKEVLFRLTPLGREVCEFHRAFDQQMQRGFIRFLQRYEAHELRFLVRVLQDARRVSFLELGTLPGTAHDHARP